MSGDYWLGVATVPILALIGTGAVVAYFVVIEALDHALGISFSARWSRDVELISDYTLRHDIWWERSFGPIFVGGWYREEPRYQEPSLRLFNRWIGIGSPDGPCFMTFHKRDLGAAPTSRRRAGGSSS